MVPRLAAGLFLLIASTGCLTYEYEHELWLNVDGSGTVHVTGRPALWTAFKGLGRVDDPEGTVTEALVRDVFERSGLRVERVRTSQRGGRTYLFAAAEFDDVSLLSYTPAFPDLRLALEDDGERLSLEGSWQRPLDAPDVRSLPPDEREGLMAVRFHLPSRVYSHRNAAEGVERGNILAWRQDVGRGLEGGRLEMGAVMDRRSILFSTVVLFAGAVILAVLLLALAFWAVARRGRRDLARDA